MVSKLKYLKLNQNSKFKIQNYLIICLIFLMPLYVYAATDSSDISLIVNDPCNNNGTCETGETEANCSNDCGCNNNGICEVARGETTGNCSNDCATKSSSGNGSVVLPDTILPQIYNLVVIPTQRSVRINWKTNEKTISNIYWGKSLNYELGIISNTNYLVNHSVLIENLLPDNTYHFITELRDRANNTAKSQDQSFKTIALPDEIPPANINDLKAKEEDIQIKLSWKNPPDPDFKEIRIVKNNQFYPKYPQDGEVIYQGGAEDFIDKNVLDEDYYYTIFTYDLLGNYSSGAIIKARPKKAPSAPLISPKPPLTLPFKPSVLPPALKKMTLEDIVFTQDGKKLLMQNSSILADAGKPMKISIDYNKLPEVLKTIIITLEKCEETQDELLHNTATLRYPVTAFGLPSNSFKNESLPSNSFKNELLPSNSFGLLGNERGDRRAEQCQNPSVLSFLLRVNQAKTEYSATILSPYEAGVYPIAVNILDFQHQQLKELSGKLLLRETVVPIQDQEGNIWVIIGRIIILVGGLGLLVVVGWIGWRIMIGTKLKRNPTPNRT